MIGELWGRLICAILPHAWRPAGIDYRTCPRCKRIEQVAECVIKATLGEWWKVSGKERRAQIEARVAELDNPETPDPADELPIGGDGA